MASTRSQVAIGKWKGGFCMREQTPRSHFNYDGRSAIVQYKPRVFPKVIWGNVGIRLIAYLPLTLATWHYRAGILEINSILRRDEQKLSLQTPSSLDDVWEDLCLDAGQRQGLSEAQACQYVTANICNSQHKLRYGQGGPHQNMVLWLRLDYPICELPTWEFPRRVWYLNLSRVSFPALRLTARLLGSTCPVHFSRTFASTACAISDPLSCHVAYGSPIGLAFVVYWGIVLFGYDTYVQKLHSHWMIDIWSPS